MLTGIVIANLGLFATSSHFSAWPFLVLATMSTMGWLSPRLRPAVLGHYLIVSVLGGLLFLLGSLPSLSCPTLCGVGLLLTIGFPPFQFWILKVLSQLDHSSICLLLGPFKIGTLWLMLSSSHSSLSLPVIPFIFGAIILFTSFSVGFILFASSSCQLIFLFSLGPTLFVNYYIFYLLALWIVELSISGRLSPLIAFCGLAGVPPFSMFWGKFFAISFLPLWGSFLLLFLSALIVQPYLILGVTFSIRASHSLPMLDLLYYIPPLLFLVLTYWIV